ncbi:MAG: POTRA domain-containing protein [Desulfobacterium sp.]|jgi:outer membrane protein insertion porin family|nr:POTRA domain-containing protein [Desulfobacterium sp.]
MKQRFLVLIYLILLVFQGSIPCVSAADLPESNSASGSGSGSDSPSGPGNEPCIRVDKLDVSGNKKFSTMRLKLRTKLWSSTLVPFSTPCLNLDWLKQDKLNLVSFYRKNGFADAAVSHEIVREKDGAALKLIVDEGFEYRISIEGADSFYSWQLNGEIPIFERGNPGDSGLRRGVLNIRKRYVDKGFNDVSVTFTKEKKTENNKTFWDVVYTIQERQRSQVASITIEGNHSIETKTIRAEMGLSEKGVLKNDGFNQKLLENDLNAIRRLYLSRGFTRAEINAETKTEIKPQTKTETRQDIQPGTRTEQKESDPETMPETEQPSIKVHITILVNEQAQMVVQGVKIKGGESLIDQNEIIESLSLRPGEPFRQYMIKSDENTLAALISKKGYPHVKVKGEKAAGDDDATAMLSYTIDPGPFVRVGKIHYTGNTKLKSKVMEDLLKIETNDPFSLQEIVDAEKRLRSISVIQSVRIEAGDLKEKKATADLEINVKERDPYYVEAAFGHDTRRLLYFNAATGNNNTFGLDIDSWIKAEVSGIGFEGETGIMDPFFLKTDMTGALSFFIQKQEELNNDFGIEAWGVSGNITKPLLPHLHAGLSLTYENRARYGNEEKFDLLNDPEKTYKTRNILKTSLVLAYDTRDSAIQPTTGFFSSLTTDIYTGFDTDLDDFMKYSLDVRRYLTPMERLTFALRTRLGYIQPFSSDNTVAEDRLFFIGGTSDVRGFKENMLAHDLEMNPVGGMSIVAASLESRISLTQKMELILFMDTGRLGETGDAAVQKGFRSSIGGGLSYGTVVGPITLVYGHKLDPDDQESAGRIHFSFGYTF